MRTGTVGFWIRVVGIVCGVVFCLVASRADATCRMCTNGGQPCPAGAVACGGDAIGQDVCIALGCDGFVDDLFGTCGEGDFASCVPLGACCSSDGACEEVTENICGALGDAYLGDGTECAEGACGCCQCFGCDGAAQCTPDTGGVVGCGNACGELSCTDSIFVLGRSCEQPGGCAPVGACCFGDGFCDEFPEDVCGSNGGSFRGAATQCSEGTCGCCQCRGCEIDPVCRPDSGGDIGCEDACTEAGCPEATFLLNHTCDTDGTCIPPERTPTVSSIGLIGIGLVLALVGWMTLAPIALRRK